MLITYTATQAAKALGVSRSTMNTYILRGRLPAGWSAERHAVTGEWRVMLDEANAPNRITTPPETGTRVVYLAARGSVTQGSVIDHEGDVLLLKLASGEERFTTDSCVFDSKIDAWVSACNDFGPMHAGTFDVLIRMS